VVAPVMLIAGAILAIVPRTRQFGFGVLLGTVILGGIVLYVGSEVLPGIPALRH